MTSRLPYLQVRCHLKKLVNLAKETRMSETAYIALGSNLGDRRANLDAALGQVRALPETKVASVSTYHETPPIDCPAGSGAFFNAVAELRTALEPQVLLQYLQRIEQGMG